MKKNKKIKTYQYGLTKEELIFIFKKFDYHGKINNLRKSK
jgi:hypothetical protein